MKTTLTLLSVQCGESLEDIKEPTPINNYLFKLLAIPSTALTNLENKLIKTIITEIQNIVTATSGIDCI